MSQNLKRLLKEMGLQLGLILLQKFQQYIEKTTPLSDLETHPRRRSTDVPLASVEDSTSNRTPD